MLRIFSFCILNTFYFLIFASTILVFVVHLCFFYRFRKMNKRLVPRRPLSASLGQLNEVGLPSTAILQEEGAVDLPSRKTPALPNGIVSAGNAVTQLIPRGTDPSYESSLKPGKIDHLSSSAPGSPPDLYVVFTNFYLTFLYWHKVEGRKNNQCFVWGRGKPLTGGLYSVVFYFYFMCQWFFEKQYRWHKIKVCKISGKQWLLEETCFPNFGNFFKHVTVCIHLETFLRP